MNTIKELTQQEKYNNMLKRKNKEIERLNNIINELEKWLQELIDNNNNRYDLYKEDKIRYDYQISNIRFQNNMLMVILEKLQELKGSDKVE